MSKLEGKVLVAQGGGPTAVINQSMIGAVLESRKFPQVTRVYGALHGVRGIVDEEFLDLTEATTHNLEAVAQTPSSGLLSTRDRPDVGYCREIFRVCQAHGVRYFFYIGGNDSADTCHIVNQQAKKAEYELRVIHIPKTIDNDLKVTHHCPGYGSAAKFVAQAFAGVNLDTRAIPGVYIGVTMGREAGFLTAAASLATKYPDDGPHLIYLPERAFAKDRFINDVRAVYNKLGHCVVAVSEGLVDGEKKLIAERYVGGERDPENPWRMLHEKQGRDEKDRAENGKQNTEQFARRQEDDHGNVPLSGTGALGDLLSFWVEEADGFNWPIDPEKNKPKKRIRADTLGYLQRSFLGCVSEVDQFEAREVGEKAAQYAIWHNRDGSVVIERVGDYAVEYSLTLLENVAGGTIKMPDEYINEEANYVTEAFRNYARPLVGDLPIVERIAAPEVPKILSK